MSTTFAITAVAITLIPWVGILVIDWLEGRR